MTNQDREEMLKLAERLREYSEQLSFADKAANALERLARSPSTAVSAEPVARVSKHGLHDITGGRLQLGAALYLHPDPRVAELEAELASAKAWRDASERRLEEVLLENAALRKDAERYRWISDNCEILVSGEPLESEQELDELIAKESSHG